MTTQDGNRLDKAFVSVTFSLHGRGGETGGVEQSSCKWYRSYADVSRFSVLDASDEKAPVCNHYDGISRKFSIFSDILSSEITFMELFETSLF